MNAATAQSVSWILESVPEPQRAGLSQIFPLIYDDLHRVARRYMADNQRSHTLQPTALVNEAFVRLRHRDVRVQGEGHARALAAIVMRSILVDHARERLTQKRGAGARQFQLSGNEIAEERDLEILDLDDLITRLADLDLRRARVVELRFFAGMSNEQIAETLGIARSTVVEDWNVAKAWLRTQLRGRTSS